MTRVAITGGIGSGKSFVCKLLAERGIAVYDCDAAAKRLMHSSADLQYALQQIVGQEVYLDGVLQKHVLAEFLLHSEANKQAINDVVHPAVAQDFLQSGMDWLESAIFFDSGFFARVPINIIIAVTAPIDVRVRRIMSRDGISQQKAMDWIASQLPQEEVVSRSTFEIVNDGQADLSRQLDDILQKIENNKH